MIFITNLSADPQKTISEKKTSSKLSAVPLCKYMTKTSEVRALYLISLEYGVQTVTGFSKNQLVVHLCQVLQHLSSKYEVSMRFHLILSIAH